MLWEARQTFLEQYVHHNYPEAIIEDISFRQFHGIFNESLVAVFCGGQYHGPYIDVVWEESILSFIFSAPFSHRILVWHDGTLYELKEAFDIELLNRDDLEIIFENHVYY
jgi:hypothetical protein